MAAAISASLASAVASELSHAGLAKETSAFAVDDIEPALVIDAESAAEVATTLRLATAAGAGVLAWGSGRHMSLGSPPHRYGLALRLGKLDKVLEHEAPNLTVTAEAGISLEDLQAQLAQENQWLPLDPPNAGTLGGLIATNLSGPARISQGTARDLLLGIEVATASGDLEHFGGRVVKNVAGYDMTKLHVGALGGLGIITKATLKVLPLSQSRLALTLSGSFDTLMSIIPHLASAQTAIEGLVFRADGDLSEIEVALAGTAAAVDQSRQFLDDLPLSDDPKLSAAAAQFAAAAALTVRAGVLPSAFPATARALLALGARIDAYPTAGVVRGSWRQDAMPGADQLASLRRHAAEEGKGALVLERAPVELKESLGVWGDIKPDFSLMKSLKAQLDPNSILSPGRFLGGL